MIGFPGFRERSREKDIYKNTKNWKKEWDGAYAPLLKHAATGIILGTTDVTIAHQCSGVCGNSVLNYLSTVL